MSDTKHNDSANMKDVDFSTALGIRALQNSVTQLQEELNAARQALSEAAQEINCAGTVAHRIRILKQEHSRQIEEAQQARESSIQILSAQADNLKAERGTLLRERDEAQRARERAEKENQRARVQVPLWKGIARAMVDRAKRVRCQFGGDHSIADCRCDPHQLGDAISTMSDALNEPYRAERDTLRGLLREALGWIDGPHTHAKDLRERITAALKEKE